MLTGVRQLDPYFKNWDSIIAIGQKTAITKADITVVDTALEPQSILFLFVSSIDKHLEV